MKVPPTPKKRNITFRYDFSSSLSEAGLSSFPLLGRQKKLRRLPHIFNRVLELPFRSDANVAIQENRDCFRFMMITDQINEDVRTHLIEILPGVTKIVIRGGNVLELSLDELELDLWRFRLPPSTRPELASAVYIAGELIVTVPKDGQAEPSQDGIGGNGLEEGNENDDDNEWFPDSENLRDSQGGGGEPFSGSNVLEENDCKTNDQENKPVSRQICVVDPRGSLSLLLLVQ